MRTNFYGALNNYHFLTTYYASVPGVKENLLEQALYQTVRASLKVNDLDPPPPTRCKRFSTGIRTASPVIAASCMSDRDLPGAVTRLGRGSCFPTFRRVARRPLSCRRRVWRSPCTYEREGNWDAAITNYDEWILTYTNHAELPGATFSRAWDYYMAGQETNALTQFTNFVAHFHDKRTRATGAGTTGSVITIFARRTISKPRRIISWSGTPTCLRPG